jgi:hypothetical protein
MAISGLQGRSPSGCGLNRRAAEMLRPCTSLRGLLPLRPVIQIGCRQTLAEYEANQKKDH